MNKTILIVEDNPANLMLATTVLEHAGYQVLSSETAADAIAKAMTEMPRLILMDVQLPGMSGLDATRQLKAEPATAGIPVIALTAFAMKGDDERILEAGCDGYIPKPFNYKDLLARVATMIGGAQEAPSP
ncbi:MAG: response regulator [Candidatus Thiodiazotropha sp. (ex Dulcina madagascariensis)]|nr:response regulator [Candidatus Thiodiazotropha sp. (ex Dulcina madagascariensis)]MCU7927064.1 response regulator [Candidatus Thiodiazotropha sp. (ex Dulcina madagascariensis)]